MYPFSIPWKYQKTLRCIENKWFDISKSPEFDHKASAVELLFDIVCCHSNASSATDGFAEYFRNRCIEKLSWLSTSLYLSVHQSWNNTPHILNGFHKFLFFIFFYIYIYIYIYILFCVSFSLSKVLFLTYINWLIECIIKVCCTMWTYERSFH